MKSIITVSISVLVLACLMGLGVTTGCGNKAGGPVKPKTAGTVEQLENSRWSTSAGTLSFQPQGVLTFTPDDPQRSENPMAGSYTVIEGVLRANIPTLMPIAGTWDGTDLVIMNEKCKRVE